MSKIKGNQDAVEVSSVLGIDVLKHYDNSFERPTRIYYFIEIISSLSYSPNK